MFFRTQRPSVEARYSKHTRGAVTRPDSGPSSAFVFFWFPWKPDFCVTAERVSVLSNSTFNSGFDVNNRLISGRLHPFIGTTRAPSYTESVVICQE